MGQKLTRLQFDILNAIHEKELDLLENNGKYSKSEIDIVINDYKKRGYIKGTRLTKEGKQLLEPYGAQRAIFIAAGFGSRMVPVTINTPKPLVRVKGIRIIDTLIDACIKSGIKDIVIVRGYLGNQFDQLKNKYPKIKFIDNEMYEKANNISSAFLAKELLENAYVFEADLLLSNPNIVKKYNYTSNFLAIPKKQTNDWCFEVENGIIKEEKVGGSDCYQMVGISYWDEKAGKKLEKDITKVFSTKNGKQAYWEQVPLVFCKNHYEVEIRECKDEDIVEIDTFAELVAIDDKYMNVKRNVLLNPGPATTTNQVKLAQIVPDICPREKEFGQMMKSLREDLVKIVHGDTNKYTSVLFCGSGTINIDVCINSLVPEGKKVLIVNNGAYSQRAAEVCEYYGLDYINLKFPVNERPDLKKVEKILKDNPDISLVHTTHNETGTGILNPIKEIGALAHKYKAIFTVDTTSTYAMRPINIEEENIDFCMASAQKGLMAMTGLSFVVGNRKLIEKSAKYPKRSYYCNLFLQYDYFEKTGEMHFTPPVQTIYSAIKAIEEYKAEGELAKWERHTSVIEAIHKGLEELGFKEVIKREEQAGLVVSALYPNDSNWSFENIHDYCYDKGFTIYPGKISSQNTFRLCALGAITEKDIADFFKVFKEALKINNVAIPVKYE